MSRGLLVRPEGRGRPSPPSPGLDTDSQDSLCRVLSRHLLTSTMQGSAPAPQQQTSPPAFTSLTNAAPPSPFPSIPDLSFSLGPQPSLAAAPRVHTFVQQTQQAAPQFGDLVMREGGVQQQGGLLLPMNPPCAPQRELAYSSSLPSQQGRLLLVESAPSSLPLGLVQPVTPMQTTSSILPTIIPNKKRRLLTFLSEQEPVQGKQEQLVFSGKDKIMLGSESAPMSLYSSLPNTDLLNESEPVVLTPAPHLTTLVPLTKASTESPTPATLIINPQPQPQSKAESTLIINSAGTAATLYTPATAFTPATACAVPVSDNLQLGLSTSAMLAPTYALMTTSPVTTSGDLLPTSSLLSSSILSFDISPPRAAAPGPGEELEPELKQWAEPVVCYKCKLCGYLCLSTTSLRHHLSDDHEEAGLDPEESSTPSSWLPAALRAGIQLTCPTCPNTFNSGRSFKVHLSEDHGWNEAQAEAEFGRRNDERRERAWEAMAEERKRQKEERKRRKQSGFEAYVDANNELRIRVPTVCGEAGEEREVNSEEEIDVDGELSAAEYLAMLAANKGARSRRPAARRSRPGRPRGSRSTGITAVRRAGAPGLQLSEAAMGEECGVQGCAVRLVEEEHLSLHRGSHSVDGGFTCPLCSLALGTWAAASLHLWRQHAMDLGLLPCSSCNYRTNSRAKLARHQVSHSEQRPWLCPQCGQGFKLSKQLKAHSLVHREKDGSKAGELTCSLCSAQFTLARHLKHHILTVHDKVKKFLCSSCGYAAASRSALQLHIRKHTRSESVV